MLAPDASGLSFSSPLLGMYSLRFSRTSTFFTLDFNRNRLLFKRLAFGKRGACVCASNRSCIPVPNHLKQVERQHWPVDLRRRCYMRPPRPCIMYYRLLVRLLRATPPPTATTPTLCVRPAHRRLLRSQSPRHSSHSRPLRPRPLAAVAVPPPDGSNSTVDSSGNSPRCCPRVLQGLSGSKKGGLRKCASPSIDVSPSPGENGPTNVVQSRSWPFPPLVGSNSMPTMAPATPHGVMPRSS